ncbi:hypothetical protein E2C01_059093 [Portunus trituberculatus]|uniref:Uncharacterized protein n=1 Tax=Portunus trituberculatus TaxID=210409 RepID=A0A5B7GY77_PORTR|nr:hypothetical protein [Portunus trituberculatus]
MNSYDVHVMNGTPHGYNTCRVCGVVWCGEDKEEDEDDMCGISDSDGNDDDRRQRRRRGEVLRNILEQIHTCACYCVVPRIAFDDDEEEEEEEEEEEKEEENEGKKRSRKIY